MDNALYVKISQHHTEVKTKVIIKADAHLKNSEYSNIRAKALKKDIEFFRSKK